MGISPDVMIMTRAEFQAAEDRAFQRGVTRGRFEQNWDNSHPDTPRPVSIGSRGRLHLMGMLRSIGTKCAGRFFSTPS